MPASIPRPNITVATGRNAVRSSFGLPGPSLKNMKLLAWNLNHRAMRRRIANWIASAIVGHSPDVIVLTEYVEGQDHAVFLQALSAGGLKHSVISRRTKGENQVLIASKHTLRGGDLSAPLIHPSVPPNALEALIEPSGLHVIGFRMPAFQGADRPIKRKTWQWLLSELDRFRSRTAVIAGDFNTALNDSAARCGDCFSQLTDSDWRCGTPALGCSWRHPQYGTERRIDHIFLSPALSLRASEYCWKFECLVPEPASRKVGVPDHAMLLAEFDVLV
jgi:hypothetical protein